MAGYRLGIDLGSTRTTLAVHRAGRTDPAGAPVPTVVFAGADGAVEIGEAARARALAQPERVVAGFVRRVGDPTPVLLGREPVPAATLVARFVARVVDTAAAGGQRPAGLVVARPSDWGPHRVAALDAALESAFGRPVPTVPQAVAAVLGHGGYEPGALVAVHDLGGSTCGTAVVRVLPGGAELVAMPEGVERFGGDDVDEAVFAHVRLALGEEWAGLDGADPAVRAAVVRLRGACTAAKERLSADTETDVPVRLPGLADRDVRLTRVELEDAIRGPVAQTVDALSRALESAGVAAGDLADVVLVGGSARIPLVTELVSAGLSRAVTVAAGGVVAAGAAAWTPLRAPVAGGPGPGGAGLGGPGGPAGVGSGGPAGPGGPGEHRAGPGTRPLQPVPAGAGVTDGHRGGRPDEAFAAALARPPKAARAFPTETARRSRMPLFVGLALLVLMTLGGLVVVGASRYAAQNSAVATTPTVDPAADSADAPQPQSAVPAPSPRRPPATSAPRVTPTASPPATTAQSTTGTPPADNGGNGGGNNNGGNNNGGNNNGGNNNGGGNNGGNGGNNGNNGAGNNGGNGGGGADGNTAGAAAPPADAVEQDAAPAAAPGVTPDAATDAADGATPPQ